MSKADALPMKSEIAIPVFTYAMFRPLICGKVAESENIEQMSNNNKKQ